MLRIISAVFVFTWILSPAPAGAAPGMALAGIDAASQEAAAAPDVVGVREKARSGWDYRLPDSITVAVVPGRMGPGAPSPNSALNLPMVRGPRTTPPRPRTIGEEKKKTAGKWRGLFGSFSAGRKGNLLSKIAFWATVAIGLVGGIMLGSRVADEPAQKNRDVWIPMLAGSVGAVAMVFLFWGKDG